MVRIGFAYNLKPDPSAAAADRPADLTGGEHADAAPGDEEPPSRRGSAGPTPERHARGRAEPGGGGTALVDEAAADDEFAEWDTRETIDAVAGALAAFGVVVHL